MIELSIEIILRVLRYVIHGFSKVDFFHLKGTSLVIVNIEIEVLMVVIFTETNIVYRMGEKTFVLLMHVYTCDARGFDLAEPFIARSAQVLLEHFSHHLQLVLVKHVSRGFSLNFPCLSRRHGRPNCVKHWREGVPH